MLDNPSFRTDYGPSYIEIDRDPDDAVDGGMGLGIICLISVGLIKQLSQIADKIILYELWFTKEQRFYLKKHHLLFIYFQNRFSAVKIPTGAWEILLPRQYFGLASDSF